MASTESSSPTPPRTQTPKPRWPLRWLLSLALTAMLANLMVPASWSAATSALALIFAAAASVAILVRTLPLQSVLFATFIIGLVGGAAHGLTVRTGLPFGPLSFGATSGPQLFNVVPWTVPLIWVVALLNSRGVARLALRPWRKTKSYGFWLMAITILLAFAFDLALESYARAKHLWFWLPTKISFTWQGASPLALLGWAFVSGIILAVIMPFLIRKQPGGSSQPDYAPLAVWGGAILVFTGNAALTGLWLPVVVDGILLLTVAVFCWRGARW